MPWWVRLPAIIAPPVVNHLAMGNKGGSAVPYPSTQCTCPSPPRQAAKRARAGGMKCSRQGDACIEYVKQCRAVPGKTAVVLVLMAVNAGKTCQDEARLRFLPSS